ncbi:hypothetical protein JR316_0011403 [Psilocybe cubensis]|uniref:Uncharacterized protein n=1 Tax=Psilocybe cubensis TaxID=181762 RepID=A0ACB8GJY7_PSICU|nr:hypothetical protein JR316_0011403 [Psilocybe cubensis]KAH9475843.1 hypothetical protein JR316_0011403 [Psilocybe cubensis]
MPNTLILPFLVSRAALPLTRIRFISNTFGPGFWLMTPAATRSALANMGRALHSTLASRVLLHMRETAHVDRDDDHIHHIPAHRKMRSDIHITRTIHRDDHDELVKCDGAEKFTPIITSKSSV